MSLWLSLFDHELHELREGQREPLEPLGQKLTQAIFFSVRLLPAVAGPLLSAPLLRPLCAPQPVVFAVLLLLSPPNRWLRLSMSDRGLGVGCVLSVIGCESRC